MHADYIFSSMPVKDLVLSMNNVTTEMKSIAENLPYRDFITVGVLVKKLEIEDKDNWIYIQEPNVKLGRLQIFNNWSSHLVKDKNTYFVGLEYFANEGDELWSKSSQEFISFAIDELCKIGIVKPENVIDATHIKVKKAYPAYFDSYKDFEKLKEWLCEIKNLYCIGRNGQHRYNNMDHSMMTAVVAVESLIKDKNNERCWSVNTDDEYHEKK